MTITQTAPTAVPPAYRDKQYLRYVAGQAISIVGDQVWYVALSWAAVQMASPAVAGMVMTVSTVPRLLLMLFGGAIVDRFGPKRIMIGSDLVRMTVALGAAAVALVAPSIALLVVMAVIFGVVSAVFMPAAGAMSPLLLRREQLSSGAAVRELTSRAALTLGAPLGGLMVAIGGLSLAAAVDATTFALSAVALFSLRPRTATAEAGVPTGMLASLKDGFRYLRSNRLLSTLIVIGLLDNLGFVGPMNIGLALVSEKRDWGAGGIGALLAGFGIGAAASAAVLLRYKPRGRIAVLVAICALLGGAGVVALAVVPQLWMGVAATSVVGITGGLMGVVLSSISQAHTDDAYRGRVSSVMSVANVGVTPLMISVTGFAVGLFGLTATFTACAAFFVAAAVLCVASEQLREARVS